MVAMTKSAVAAVIVAEVAVLLSVSALDRSAMSARRRRAVVIGSRRLSDEVPTRTPYEGFGRGAPSSLNFKDEKVSTISRTPHVAFDDRLVDVTPTGARPQDQPLAGWPLFQNARRIGANPLFRVEMSAAPTSNSHCATHAPLTHA